MSITSHGFQPTLHCPCSWTSLRKPYLAPVNGQKQLLELADDSAQRGPASAAICISVHRSGATQQEQESNLQLAVVLHCSTELQGSGGGRALTLGQVLELIPTTQGCVPSPRHRGAQKHFPKAIRAVCTPWPQRIWVVGQAGLGLQVPTGTGEQGLGLQLQLGSIPGSSRITSGKQDKRWRGNEMISREGGAAALTEELVVMAKHSLILRFLLG